MNEALDPYNKIQRKRILEKELKKKSESVNADSMSVLKAFEKTDKKIRNAT